MAEAMSSKVIDIIKDKYLLKEEDLILFDETDDEGLYEECTDDPEKDDDYDPQDYEEPRRDYIPLCYKEKVVALADRYPKWKLRTLQKLGASRLKRKDILTQWRKDVKTGGTKIDRIRKIDNDTFERFREARSCCEQVTNRTLQQWALAAANPFQSEEFTFLAGRTWVQSFKKRHKIKRREITKFVSKRDVVPVEETLEAASKFQLQTSRAISKFNPDFVINTDEIECSYESAYDRRLDSQGVKTVLVKKQNLDKTTRSYTAQYGITASGKLLPLVYLCVRETGGEFDPKVSETVEKLTREYGNIVVACSKSGKLRKDLYRDYLKTTLAPYVRDNDFLLIIDSWEGQNDACLYNEVFENSNGDPSCTLKVIPEKCTSLCQPCDVYFYRQVKNLIKRLQNCQTLLEQRREISSREDALKIHSLVHHQLSAPSFKEMIRYAWYAAKLAEDRPIFSNVDEICFPITISKRNCSCKEVAFIKCSWCDACLCFKCFYDEYHPKKCSKSSQANTDDESD